MKNQLIIICTLFYSIYSFSQERKIEKLLTLIDKKEFQKCFEKLTEFRNDHPINPLGYLAFMQYYGNESNPSKNVDSAYLNFEKAVLISYGTEDREMIKYCEEFKFCLISHKSKLDSLGLISLSEYKKDPTLDKYNRFIKIYKRSELAIKEAIRMRDELAYSIAKKENTLVALETYLLEYPKSILITKCINEIYHFSLREAELNKKVDVLDEYIKKHPKSENQQACLKKIEEILYFNTLQADDNEDFVIYLKRYYKTMNYDLVLSNHKSWIKKNLEIENDYKKFNHLIHIYPNEIYDEKVYEKWQNIVFEHVKSKRSLPLFREYLKLFKFNSNALNLISSDEFSTATTWLTSMPYLLKNGKYTYVSPIEKKKLTEMQFDKVEPFFDNVAIVDRDQKVGVIDENWNTILPFEFDEITNRYNFLIAFKKVNEEDGYYQIFNKQGRLIIDQQFDRIDDDECLIIGDTILITGVQGNSFKLCQIYHGELVKMMNMNLDNFSLISSMVAFDGSSDNAGDAYISHRKLILVSTNGKDGAINWDGKIVIPFEYESIENAEDYLIFSLDFQGVKKFGVMNLQGEILIKPQYSYLKYLDNEFFAFSNNYSSDIPSTVRDIGVINQKNEIVIPAIYQNIEMLNENLFKVFIGGEFKNNKQSPYHLYYYGGKQGVINVYNQKIVDFENDEIILKDSFFVVRKYNKFGLVNLEGKIILDFNYDNIKIEKDAFIVGIGGKLEDTDESMENNFLERYVGGKYGVFSKLGKLIIPIVYDQIDRKLDLFIVGNGKYNPENEWIGKYGLFDINGKLILNIENDEIHLENSKYIVNKGTITLLDEYFKPIKIKPYSKIFNNNNSNYFSVMTGNKWGVINNRGEEIVPLLFESLEEMSGENVRVKYNPIQEYNNYLFIVYGSDFANHNYYQSLSNGNYLISTSGVKYAE